MAIRELDSFADAMEQLGDALNSGEWTPKTVSQLAHAIAGLDTDGGVYIVLEKGQATVVMAKNGGPSLWPHFDVLPYMHDAFGNPLGNHRLEVVNTPSSEAGENPEDETNR